MHKDLLSISKNISFKTVGTKDGDCLPVLQQKLICELDGHPESYCFNWKLMIGQDVVDSGEFKDCEDDAEETDRFLNILHRFSEYKVKRVLKWYRNCCLSRDPGIIISRPYVCPEISDFKCCFIDRLRLRIMHNILNRFVYKNATVDVPFFNETHQLRVRFEKDGINFIATMTLEDDEKSNFDILALDNDKVVGMEWKSNFFLFDLNKFVEKSIKDARNENVMKKKIHKTVFDICQKAVENHLFETPHDGKIAIEKDIEAELEKLVEKDEISSYEIRCKLFGTNRPSLYIDISCTKDGEFDGLQIETLTPLTPED